MALKARKEFPGIIFKKSIMAGDSLIDMQFGKHLGMKTVLIGDDNNIAREHPKFVDFYSPDLLTFSSLISVK
jgi:histidinol phosphatase-like enzyme